MSTSSDLGGDGGLGGILVIFNVNGGLLLSGEFGKLLVLESDDSEESLSLLPEGRSDLVLGLLLEFEDFNLLLSNVNFLSENSLDGL